MSNISESLESKFLELLLKPPLFHTETLRLLVFRKLKHCGRNLKTSMQKRALVLEGMADVAENFPAAAQPHLIELGS